MTGSVSGYDSWQPCDVGKALGEEAGQGADQLSRAGAPPAGGLPHCQRAPPPPWLLVCAASWTQSLRLPRCHWCAAPLMLPTHIHTHTHTHSSIGCHRPQQTMQTSVPQHSLSTAWHMQHVVLAKQMQRGIGLSQQCAEAQMCPSMFAA